VIYILLSVLFSSVLFIIIKLFANFKIDTLQALVVNYLTASGMGFFFFEEAFNPSEIICKQWFMGSFMLGLLFILIFYVTAITSQRNGLSVASVASKMSVIIPVLFGVLLYGDKITLIKIIGILLALVAVYFTSKKEKGSVTYNNNLVYPLLIFIGAGAIDTSLKYFQTFYLSDKEISLFSSNTFFAAFVFGIILLIAKSLKDGINIKVKNILGGIALGIPNYFSLHYLIKMLDSEVFESAIIFTIHNVAIVVITTLAGFFIFKEKISFRNWMGIALALIAILLVTI